MPRARKENAEEQFGEIPEIKKNEVIQETDFYKSIKKYEGKESFNPWQLVLAAIVIILIIAAIIYLF